MAVYSDPEAKCIAAALREDKREQSAEDCILATLESIGRRLSAVADLCATTIDAQNRIERRLSAIEQSMYRNSAGRSGVNHDDEVLIFGFGRGHAAGCAVYEGLFCSCRDQA